ncbi:AraC family transcriptional regulator [uncultured Megasphaera sp.]|uniref:AraC family transcriptional regulator n=1 Tax=uncultured Megasphaera sp. TaxID=165188 RepID=UPI0025CCD5AF|nr:AraC family transcriptional regulator [uncultured Megasphaera sp.]
MAVVLPVVSSTFAPHTKPMLVTIYEAPGYITQLPRTMHRHEDILEIILVHQGQGIYSVDGKKYTIEKGDILIIDSGTVHDESALSQSDLSIGSCGVTELHIPGLAKNHLLKPHQSPLLKTGDMFLPLSQMMKSMYAYTTGSSCVSAEAANYLLQAFIVTVYQLLQQRQEGEENKEDNELARQIKAYVDEHYMESITLAKLAAQFHVSPSYVTRVYKKVYGYAVMQYILRRRIGEAQTLIIDTDLSLTEIASRVGYSSSSYFHDMFLKMTGISPRRYREIYRSL